MPKQQQPSVVTVRIRGSDEGTKVIVEHGNVEVERNIPTGFGLVRMGIIMDPQFTLDDVELVYEKA